MDSLFANEDIFPEATVDTPSAQPSTNHAPTTTLPELSTRTEHPHDFIILHKNARGLHTDDRFDELLSEIHDTPWHIIALNETWRKHKRELWTTKQDHHIFAGCGHDETTRGVGFLIHSSLSRAVRNFNAINERIAYVDVHIHSWKLRIVSAYFPHRVR